MSERNAFPEPAATKGGGGTPPGGVQGRAADAPRRRFVLWLVAALALGAASLYGLLVDRSVRSDPFARSASLVEWLFRGQPHPALARMPVVPIGANGTLTFRPAETAWINTPYLPQTESAEQAGAAFPTVFGLAASAYAAGPPKVAVPPNTGVIDPKALKKESLNREASKQPPAAPTGLRLIEQNRAAQAVEPPTTPPRPSPTEALVPAPDGPPRILHAQFLADGRRGWVGGEAAGLLATADGGKSWAPVGRSADIGRLRAFHFDAAGQVGWAFTTLGAIRTEAGGEEWNRPSTGLRSATSLDTYWHFDQGSWTDVGPLRLRVAPAAPGTLAPIPLTRGDLFTTKDGEAFALPNGARVDTSAIADQATTQARELGSEPGRFHAVFFPADGGRVAWAVGDGGTLVRLTEVPEDRESAGAEWSQVETPTQANLRSIYFQADSRIGWAASGWDDGNEESDRPVLLQTVDGGATWQRLPYRHLPAPWLFLALPAFVLTGYRTATTWTDLRRVPQRRASVADTAATDAPIGWEDKDALGLQAIARALSKFVRNRNTIPPLTFAVSGPWGTGKSSLMNLVAEDLRTFGTRPVWFNAWHHQKEDHLLAALLEAIRSQAIPTWWRWSGLAFRSRLLLRRVRSDLQSALAVVFLLGVAGVALTVMVEADDVRRLVEAATTTAIGEWLTETLSGQAAALGSFGAGLYAVTLALLKLRVITLNPAQLMATLRDRSRVADLRDQLGFRHKFTREFNSVCHALRTRRTAGMVIVIDDLDRCQPDNVLDILEAVNYLATAGPCFIFLGIDAEKVTSSVAHGFKDSILILPNGHEEDGAKYELKPDAVALATFARSYLEKLINITVPVPLASAETSAVLLDLSPLPQEGQPPTAGQAGDDAPLSPWPGRMRRWLRDADDIAKGLTAIAVIACVALSGAVRAIAPQALPDLTTPPAAQAPAVATHGGTLSTPAATLPAPAAASDAGTEEPAVAAPQVGPDDVTTHPLLPYLPYLPPVLALLLVGWWTAGRVLTGREPVVEDSADFREALRIFNQAIFAASPTPRGVKRFENRLRYFAMRSRGDDRPPDWIDRLFGRLGYRVRTREREAEAVDIPEPTLVALGAIAGVDQSLLRLATKDGGVSFGMAFARRWLPSHQKLADHAQEETSETQRLRRDLSQKDELSTAIAAFETAFSGYWPPTADQVRAFCDLSGTIRD